jgi:hypothetical protein
MQSPLQLPSMDVDTQCARSGHNVVRGVKGARPDRGPILQSGHRLGPCTSYMPGSSLSAPATRLIESKQAGNATSSRGSGSARHFKVRQRGSSLSAQGILSSGTPPSLDLYRGLWVRFEAERLCAAVRGRIAPIRPELTEISSRTSFLPPA